MNKFATIMKLAWSEVSRHSAGILTVIGTGGLISAGGMGIFATVKAVRAVDEKLDEDATTGDIIKTTWKYYIPMIATTVTSTGCIIFASKENSRRNAALATAYTLSETAMNEYSNKVIETVGKKKEGEIRDAIAKDHVEKKTMGDGPIVVSGHGSVKCYDVFNDRCFDSNIDTIRQAVNKINFNMNRDGYASLNDFYYEVGANPVPYGDDMGWSLMKGLMDVHFSSVLSEDDIPCLAITFSTPPVYDYSMY